MGETRFVMGKPERHVFVDLGADGNKIKMYLKVIILEGVD